jgi:hypothetical protein
VTSYDYPPRRRGLALKVGAAPPIIMAPHDVALESFHYWTEISRFRKYKRTSALGLMAMEDGETSFRLGVVGDHGHAWGPFQHQRGRRQEILRLTTIDVATAPHLDALAGADYEINKIPPYRHIADQVEALTDPEAIVRLLVTKFEQAENPGDRDVRRRLNEYNFWDNELKGLGL